MKQAYGPNETARQYTDRAMSFPMEADRDQIIRDTAKEFERKIKQDRAYCGLEAK